MLSSVKIIILSSSLINPPVVNHNQPVNFSGNYSLEAAKYLRSKMSGSDTIKDINDIMYREILKELKDKEQK